jgi:two-component system, response regulator PdtaR
MASSEPIIKALRSTRVALVHPMDEDGQVLDRQLRRIGCQISCHWPYPRTVPDIDVLLLLLSSDTEWNLAEQLGQQTRKFGLIAIVGYESPILLQNISDLNVHGVLTKPIRPLGMLSALVAAISTFQYEQRLTARIAKLDETLKMRRLIERAVKVLALRRNMQEDDAYSFVRRQAMNKQISLSEIANTIINAEMFL